MFLPGSNLEHIYINAGQMPNEEVTFKIDNIKYIDKTKIKICKKEGKDYVTCLPRNFVDPSLEKVESEISQLYASFRFFGKGSISNLIDPIIYMSDGNSIVYKEKIDTIDDFKVRINDLIPNKKYQIAIYSYLNKQDGKEMNLIKLYDEYFKTSNYLDLVKIDCLENSISLDISYLDSTSLIKEVNVYNLDKTLFKKYTFNKHLPSIILNDVFSNHEYIVEIIATDINHLHETSFIETIKTKSYITPTINIINFVYMENSYSFDLDIYDPSLKGRILYTELYKENTLVFKENNKLINSYNDLDYNSKYKLNVAYCYDLKDGLGEKIIIKSKTFNTDLSDVTILSIYHSGFVNLNQTLKININIKNPDNLNINEVKINNKLYAVEQINKLDFQNYNIYFGPLTKEETLNFTITSFTYLQDNILYSKDFAIFKESSIIVTNKIKLVSVYTNKGINYTIMNDKDLTLNLEISLPNNFEIYWLDVNHNERFNNEISFKNNVLTVNLYQYYEKIASAHNPFCPDIDILAFNDIIHFTNLYVWTNFEITYGLNNNDLKTLRLTNPDSYIPIINIKHIEDVYSADQFNSSSSHGSESYETLLNIKNDLIFVEPIIPEQFAAIIGNNKTIYMDFSNLNENYFYNHLLHSQTINNLNIVLKGKINLANDHTFTIIKSKFLNNININYDNFIIEDPLSFTYTTITFSLDRGFDTFLYTKYIKDINISGDLTLNNANNIQLIFAGEVEHIENININLNTTISYNEDNLSFNPICYIRQSLNNILMNLINITCGGSINFLNATHDPKINFINTDFNYYKYQNIIFDESISSNPYFTNNLKNK